MLAARRTILRLLGACLVLVACKFPYPADVADDDAEMDAGRRDATGDAHVRSHPLVENHQAADLVIGAPDFIAAGRHLPADGRYLDSPSSIGGTASRLWIADFASSRVLLFRPLPAANYPSAAFALGKAGTADIDDNTSVTAANVYRPNSVREVGGKLLVADSARNRILIWNTAPSGGTSSADVVLGQRNFGSATAGNGADQLYYPVDLWSDGTRLVVVDSGNHRVLIWSSFPTQSGQPADIVLGQPSFGIGAEPSAPSATVLSHPSGVASDGDKLVVADGFYRVLVWEHFPTQNAAPADLAVGARDTSSPVIAIPGSRSTMLPTRVAMFDGALFVSDVNNDRVLVFDPMPSVSVEDVSTASQALGQVAPNVVTLAQATSERSLYQPSSVDIIDGHLFVGDVVPGRVLRYRLNLD